MRKDLLQTDEQKQNRRKCLEENRNLTTQRLTTSESPSFSNETPKTSSLESKPTSPNSIDQVNFIIFFPIEFVLIVINGNG